MSGRVLCIEDDPDICRALRVVLSRAGFEVLVSTDGEDGVRTFHDERPALVLLDVGLPGIDGWAVLERIREVSDVPVLMLTARGLETDKVRGLQGGADDYVTKPFGNQELVARVHALMRRSEGAGRVDEVLDDGVLRIDPAQRLGAVGGRPVELTPTEFRLVSTLARHHGQVLTSEQLLEHAWHDPTGIGPDRVKFAVLRLRRKLGWDDLATSPIEAVRGVGYRYRRPGGR
jgi:DNA-binding response OmpR family regulator